MKILANDTAILVPMAVPCVRRSFSLMNWNEFSFRIRPSIPQGSVLGSVGYTYGTNRMLCILFPFPLLEVYLCTS